MKTLYESILDDEDDILDDRSNISDGVEDAIKYMKKFLIGDAGDKANTIYSVINYCLANYYVKTKFEPEVTSQEYEEFLGIFEEPGKGDKEFLSFIKRTLINDKIEKNTYFLLEKNACISIENKDIYKRNETKYKKYLKTLLNKKVKINDTSMVALEYLTTGMGDIQQGQLILDIENLADAFIFNYCKSEDKYYITIYPKKQYLYTGNKLEYEFLDELFKLLKK